MFAAQLQRRDEYMHPLDVDRAAQMLAAFWTITSIAVIVVALRFYVRNRTRAIGCDDWTMLASLLCQLVTSGLATKLVESGGTRHWMYLSQHERSEVTKWAVLHEAWGTWAFTPTKVSVGLLVLRLISPVKGWRFWTTTTMLIVLTAANVINATTILVRCVPTASIWNHDIKPVQCWNSLTMAKLDISVASYNVFVDVALVVMAWSILWALRVGPKRKLELYILLSLGLIAAACGAVKTSQLWSLAQDEDMSWDVYSLIVLAGVENFLILVCGSIPVLRPLWHLKRTQQPWSSYTSSQSEMDSGIDSARLKSEHVPEDNAISTQVSGERHLLDRALNEKT